MNSDIYLFLLRQEGKFETFKDVWGSGGAAGAGKIALKLAKWLKGFVMGDSLDAPFIKFIRVTSLSHSLAFGDGDEQLKYGDDDLHHGTWHRHEDDLIDGIARREGGGWRAVQGGVRTAEFVGASFGSGYKTVDRSRRMGSRRDRFESGNMFLNSHTPSHGALSFSKQVDKATPQLAFGCSAQERFPFAIFFYRRRTGLGIEGSRMPYLVIGLDKVLVSGWSLNGDSESVTLKYKRIAWAATDQISDTNVSIPGFTRTWDVESRTGGEGGWALGLQALTLALAGMTGLLAKPFSS